MFRWQLVRQVVVASVSLLAVAPTALPVEACVVLLVVVVLPMVGD